MTKIAEVLTQPQRALPIVRVAAHMAWVDRRLVADEVSAARSVAAVLGVETAGAGLLARGPLPTVAFESSTLEAGAKEVVYATALWIALADGVLDPIEREALAGLARCLRLDPERREHIESLVWPWGGNAGEWERRYAGVLTQLEQG
jgi:tellurite resistance protein